MIKKKCKKGFTLVELIVTITVLGVVMAMVVAAFASHGRNSAVFRQRERVYHYENQARLALLGMVRDVRHSRDVIYFGDSLPTVPIGTLEYREVLRLRGRVEPNPANPLFRYRVISYYFLDVAVGDEFGAVPSLIRLVSELRDESDISHVDLTNHEENHNWPVAFVPVFLQGVDIDFGAIIVGDFELVTPAPSPPAAPPFALPFVIDNAPLVQIELTRPGDVAAVDHMRGMTFATTVAIQRRP